MPRLIGSRTDPRQQVSKTAEAALSSLIGVPAPIEEAQPLTSAERLAAILQRARQITHPPINPLQRDFHKFLREEVETKDEARAGQVAHTPDWPYIKEVCDALVECPRLMTEKSRRVLASWITCAFDVWLCAGGQDPRWPELMLSTANRQVIIASRKLKEIQGSAWFLKNRIKFIVDRLELNHIRERWPEFPTFTWIETEATASNGGLISAIASGKDQSRAAGATFIHCEEVAFWEEAKDSIESMIPTLLGGGHIVLITTPQVGSYAADIAAGTLKHKEELHELVSQYSNEMEYSQDEYDEDDYEDKEDE